MKKRSNERQRNKSTTPLLVSSLRSLSPLMKFPGIGALIICAEVQVWPRCRPGRPTCTPASSPPRLLFAPLCSSRHFASLQMTGKEKLQAKAVCFAETDSQSLSPFGLLTAPRWCLWCAYVCAEQRRGGNICFYEASSSSASLFSSSSLLKTAGGTWYVRSVATC